jgi:hypothetical protein
MLFPKERASREELERFFDTGGIKGDILAL